MKRIVIKIVTLLATKKARILVSVLIIALIGIGVMATQTNVFAEGWTGILKFFGKLTGTAIVQQSILVDGKGFNSSGGNSWELTYDIGDSPAIAGNTYTSLHTLQNRADVPLDVKLVSSYSPKTNPDAIETTYSTDITDNNTDFGSQSNEVMAVIPGEGLTLNDLFAGNGLSYKYTVIDGGAYDGASPVIAVIDLENGRHITIYPGWGDRTGTHTLQYSETVSKATSDSGDKVVDFVLEYSNFRDDKLYKSVTCGYGDFEDVKADTTELDGTEIVTRVAIQHQAANTGETDRLQWLKFGGITYVLGGIVEDTAFTLQSGEIMNFAIINAIRGNAIGKYTVYTNVVPVIK